MAKQNTKETEASVVEKALATGEAGRIANPETGGSATSHAHLVFKDGRKPYELPSGNSRVDY